MCGTAIVHWLVSCAYIACPLSSLLVLVVAMESELRWSLFQVIFPNFDAVSPLRMLVVRPDPSERAHQWREWFLVGCASDDTYRITLQLVNVEYVIPTMLSH